MVLNSYLYQASFQTCYASHDYGRIDVSSSLIVFQTLLLLHSFGDLSMALMILWSFISISSVSLWSQPFRLSCINYFSFVKLLFNFYSYSASPCGYEYHWFQRPSYELPVRARLDSCPVARFVSVQTAQTLSIFTKFCERTWSKASQKIAKTPRQRTPKNRRKMPEKSPKNPRPKTC